MPWTKRNFPNAMKNLSDRVRNKAIKIANAILRKGALDEGAAIATSISKAKESKKKSKK